MTSTDPQDSNGGNSGPNSLNGTEGRISSGYSINGILGIQHSNDPNVNSMKRKRVDDHGKFSARNGRKTRAFPERKLERTRNMKFPFTASPMRKNFAIVVAASVIVQTTSALVRAQESEKRFLCLFFLYNRPLQK